MRNYNHIDKYLDELQKDVYPQPEDDKHIEWASAIISVYADKLHPGSVLDVGCGMAFVQDIFEGIGFVYEGITLGRDAKNARKLCRNVRYGDFSFLPYKDCSFDVIFSRHSLEHSPMPLLSLFEWHRVSKHDLLLIMPNHEYWKFGGRNHYSVMTRGQIKSLLLRSGWKIIVENDADDEFEHVFLCNKVNNKGIRVKENFE
jgi:SAM-dependent methyltransferase